MKRILTVFTLVLSLMTIMSGCVIREVNYGVYDNASSYTMAEDTVSLDNINEIDINWISGKVNIETSDTDKVTFSESHKDGISKDLYMRYLVANGKLTIQYCRSGLKVRNGSAPVKKDLTVYVPSNVVFREIECDTVSSNLNMKGVATRELKLENVSGKVSLSDVRADEIDVETVSGNISIETDENVRRFEIETVSGNVTITAPSVSSVSAEGVSCSLTLNLDDADFRVELDGVSKRMKVDGTDYREVGDGNYVFGNGSGRVEVELVSGILEINVK
jgi:DUF4097 and DUF4098 domain-containing protein YvlB